MHSFSRFTFQFSGPTSAYPPAFPVAFASWIILLHRSIRWTPAPKGRTARELPRSRFSFYVDVRVALSAGFNGGEDWSRRHAPAPILVPFGPSPSVRVGACSRSRRFKCAFAFATHGLPANGEFPSRTPDTPYFTHSCRNRSVNPVPVGNAYPCSPQGLGIELTLSPNIANRVIQTSFICLLAPMRLLACSPILTCAAFRENGSNPATRGIRCSGWSGLRAAGRSPRRSFQTRRAYRPSGQATMQPLQWGIPPGR